MKSHTYILTGNIFKEKWINALYREMHTKKRYGIMDII
ncbi:hypothetical protein Mpsy_2833 [Methanolobus psychrophilus R15]|nr:hypothetical protein Mpsy_2833 [Methanolobus psychrophilus R15]